MKIDKEQLKRLAEKSDGELWSDIRQIAGSHGFKLPEKVPPHEELMKIRAALTGAEKLNMLDAVKLLNNYRKKG